MHLANLHKTVRQKLEKRFPVGVEHVAQTRAVTEAKPIVQEFLLSLGAAPDKAA